MVQELGFPWFALSARGIFRGSVPGPLAPSTMAVAFGLKVEHQILEPSLPIPLKTARNHKSRMDG